METEKKLLQLLQLLLDVLDQVLDSTCYTLDEGQSDLVTYIDELLQSKQP